MSDLLVVLSLLCVPILSGGVAIGIARLIGWRPHREDERLSLTDQSIAFADLQYRLARLEQSAERTAEQLRLLVASREPERLGDAEGASRLSGA